MISKLIEFVNYLREDTFDVDSTDKLFARITPRLFICCALLVWTYEFSGNPVNCLGGSEWTDSWVEYADGYCFVEGTYYLPLTEKLGPSNDRTLVYPSVRYYSWIAFLFLLQCFAFYLPYLTWHTWNSSFLGGFGVGVFGETAHRMSFVDGSDVTSRTKLARKVERMLACIRIPQSKVKFASMIHRYYLMNIKSKSMTVFYLLLKFTNLLVTYLSLYTMSTLLIHNGDVFDFGPIYAMINNVHSWKTSANFPRVVLCDFEIRGIESNVQKYTQQCGLPINFINEFLFVVLWVWHWVLLVFGTINVAYWTYFLFWPGRRGKFILGSIMRGNGTNEWDFVTDYTEKLGSLDEKLREIRELTEEINVYLRRNNLVPKSFEQQRTEICRQMHEDLKMLRKQFLILKFRVVFDDFLRFLNYDGIVLFKLMRLNSSELITDELLSQLLFEWARIHAGVGKDQLDRLIAQDDKISNFFLENVQAPSNN